MTWFSRSSRRLFTGILVSLSLSSPHAWSASYVAAPLAALEIPHCELTTRFTGEQVREPRIFWAFAAGNPVSIGGQDCSELFNPFRLYIPGAKTLRTDGRIVYPEHVPSVQADHEYFMRVVKKWFRDPLTGNPGEEWVVQGWQDGFRSASR